MSVAMEAVAINKNQSINNQNWAEWILTHVNNLPGLKALEWQSKVADEERLAKQQALYNPDLSLSFTEKGEQEYQLGVSQTIDWYDKSLANGRLGNVDFDLVKIQNHIELEQKLAQALLAYIDYSREKQLLVIARQQEKLLEQLSADLKIRSELGDVGTIDVELTYLSLSQSLQRISLSEIRYRNALAELEKTLNTSQIPYESEKTIWRNSLQQKDLDDFVGSNLSIRLAEKQLQRTQALSKIAGLVRKNNPTLGLGVGRDGDENTVSLEFSIPLNLRNDYSAEYRAALNKISQSQWQLKEEKRLLQKQLKLSLDNYQQLNQRVSTWQKLTAKRVVGSKKILNKLWQSGDMATADYLFSLQQRTDSLISTIELFSEMQKAWVDWLLATNQVESWLRDL